MTRLYEVDGLDRKFEVEADAHAAARQIVGAAPGSMVTVAFRDSAKATFISPRGKARFIVTTYLRLPDSSIVRMDELAAEQIQTLVEQGVIPE